MVTLAFFTLYRDLYLAQGQVTVVVLDSLLQLLEIEGNDLSV